MKNPSLQTSSPAAQTAIVCHGRTNGAVDFFLEKKANKKTTGGRHAKTALTILDVQQKFKSTGGFGVQQRDDQMGLGD